MDEEQRKAEIRLRLRISKYSRPDALQYTDENDHNPLVLEGCPKCHATGKYDRYVSDGCYSLEVCPECNGKKVTGELVPQFQNNNPPVFAKLRADGWLKCPTCGVTFSTRDRSAWTGRRHINCGQVILLEASDGK